MQIFKNRPLALLCLIFILSSVTAFYLSSFAVKILLTIISVSALTLLILTLAVKKNKLILLFAFLCSASILLSFTIQYIFVDLKQEKMLSFEGDCKVEMLIIEQENISEHSSEYKVEIKGIDRKRLSEPSVLICAFPSALKSGDIVYAKAVISPAGENVLGYTRYLDREIYIQTAVYESTQLGLISENNLNAEILFSKIKNFASDTVDRIFGTESSALIKAFIIGDTSKLENNVIRDFRRSGVSHLLAISGLHISLIMGMLELILQKIRISKSLRCLILSFAALLFLAMTGFSMSASRSVIMLMAVYFGYLFARENDSLTSLFAAVAIIMLLSPISVNDVGLWLSFVATLGIISVYIPLCAYFRAKKQKKSKLNIFVKILKKFISAFLLTFICNAFICAVIWICFGEISAVSLISNLILSPLSEVFVVGAFIAGIISPIPFLGSIAVKLISFLGNFIIYLCGAFSSIKGSLVSLRYSFAEIIIVIMSVLLIICLIIKLKHKWLILLIPSVSLLAFAVCFFIHGYMRGNNIYVEYYSEKTNELITVSRQGSSSVIDLSYGGYSFLSNIAKINSSNYCTEISDYVVTHYHSYHPSAVEKLCKRNLVRKIYLPMPKNDKEENIMREIIISMQELSVEVTVYKSGEYINFSDGGWAVIMFGSNEKHGVTAIVGNKENFVTYLSHESDFESLSEIISKSESIIFGKHFGYPKSKTDIKIPDLSAKRIFYADYKSYESYCVKYNDAAVFIPPNDEEKIFFELTVE